MVMMSWPALGPVAFITGAITTESIARNVGVQGRGFYSTFLAQIFRNILEIEIREILGCQRWGDITSSVLYIPR
jgi:hypothetical protein